MRPNPGHSAEGVARREAAQHRTGRGCSKQTPARQSVTSQAADLV